MPRKTLGVLGVEIKAAEEFATTALANYEAAKTLYDQQDATTKAAIDRVVETLREHATGQINVKIAGSLVPIKVNDLTFGYYLFQLGVALVVDLALVGLRLVNFKFDPNVCALCGEKIKTRKQR